MANVDTHKQLAASLLADMRKSDPKEEWPIIVDAGYYALFHSLEALSALECRDSYTFADAADILDNVLSGPILDRSIFTAYNYLFYFRRGAIYGWHTPTAQQIVRYTETVEKCVEHVQSKFAGVGTRDLFRKSD